LLANIIAMLFQALTAELGIATGQNLAELCRHHNRAPVSWAMWLGCELAAPAEHKARFSEVCRAADDERLAVRAAVGNGESTQLSRAIDTGEGRWDQRHAALWPV
jgi:hypothetical protein